MLGNDIARCEGYKSQPTCFDCRRRTEPLGERVVWMAAPCLYRGVCPSKIQERLITHREVV